MVYVILLDDRQKDPDSYTVSYSASTEDACLAQTELPSDDRSWPKRNYSKPQLVRQHSLGGEPGNICRMTRLKRTARKPAATDAKKKTLSLALGAGAMVLLGLTAGKLLKKSGKGAPK